VPLLGFAPHLDRAAVTAAEAAILAAEGPYHVAGRYIADPMLCERQRRLLAEAHVEATLRRAAYAANAARLASALQDAA
jgi:hypothetical protein